MAGAFQKHRFFVYNQSQHPYRHNLAEFSYSSPALPGVDNVEEALNWLINVMYPLSQSAVATQALLPTDGIITFDGVGRVQGAHASFQLDDQIFLTTTGTLPANFLPNTTYKVSSTTGGLTLVTNDGTPVVFVPGGAGVHTIHSIANAFRVVFDDGDGKSAAYRYEQRQGDVAPLWYKIYDMDWSQDQILTQFQNITQDMYVYQQGKDDTDVNGVALVGAEAGQHIFGGASDNTNLTLHANSSNGVGAIRSANDIIPIVTAAISLGTTLLRYLNLYISNSAVINTMTLTSGQIVDSTGTISFDNENLVTTGNVSGTNLVASNQVQVASDIIVGSGSITSASGNINFNDEDLTTTGDMTADRFNLSGGSFIEENGATDLLISSFNDEIDFSLGNLKNILSLVTSTLNATTATLGQLTFSTNTISSTNKIVLSPDISNLLVEVNGNFTVSNTATITGVFTANGNIVANADLDVAGITTVDDIFLNGAVTTANAFIDIVQPVVGTTFEATSYKGSALIDPSNNSENIADIVKFPFTATTQDHVPHWDTGTSAFINKAISYPAHDGLVGLLDDDHTQYHLLAGRTGGQELAGAANAAPGNITLIGQAGTPNANEVVFKDKATPFTDATFAGSWQGYDIGKTAGQWRHLYSRGEHFGLRFENVAVLPAANVANIGRVVYNTADLKTYIDTGGTWAVVAGSSGGGVTNLITDGNADDAVASIFTTYQDAAGTRPTDGTGGAPTVTTTRSTISPLNGVASFTLVKPASNVQGQGWAVDSSALDLAFRAKSLKFSMDYIVDSGTFVAGSSSTDSDVILYFYDITNAKLVEPSNIKFFSNSNTLSDKLEASVQFDSNCTAFRTILHVASTSANAYTLKVDNVTVSPQNYVYGTPVTDWQSYLPTFTGFGTVASNSFWWRRVGQDIEIRGHFVSGTPTGVEARVSLPPGYVSGDSTLLASPINKAGTGNRQNANGYEIPILLERTVQYVTFGIASVSGSGYTKQNANAITNAAEAIILFASIPCQGLSSAVKMSDGFDGRVIAANRIATAAVGSGADIIFDQLNIDKTAASTSTTFTCQSSGIYSISATAYFSLAVSAKVNLNLVKNGASIDGVSFQNTSASVSTVQPSLNTVVDLVAGDVIKFQWVGTINTVTHASHGTGTNFGEFSIFKIQGSPTISESEVLTASGQNLAGTLIPNTAWTAITTPSIVDSTHGSLSTSGVFTPSSAGRFLISVTAVFSSNSVGIRGVRIRKNGNATGIGQLSSATVGGLSAPTSSGYLNLLATDTVTFEGFQNSGGNLALDTDTGISTSFYIVKI